MKTSTILLLAGVLIYLVDFAKAQSANDTNTFEPTCPPPRTCSPQPVCTCPTIAECPTETTRTRGRSPGRTRGTETNRTRTDTTTGRDRTATNGTHTGTRTQTRSPGTRTRSPGARTRSPGRTRRPGTRTRKRCVPKVPPGCPEITTAPPVTTTTMAETTSTDANITMIEPTDFNITTFEPTTTDEFDLNDTTTEMGGNTTEPFNVTEATTTEATTTEATTTEMITTDINTTEPFDFNVTDAITTTDANATDANATEATTTEATTTEATTTEAATPPAPLTTQPPCPNITATCSSPIVDVSGQKQPPIRIFQFLVDKYNLLEYTEATDLLEFIAWLTKLSNIHGTMKSTLLGISSYHSGLSVTIAVSFKVFPGTNYTTSSTQIIEAVYNSFDILKEYYNVVDIKLVSLSTESSSPQPHQGQSGHMVIATKPVIALSVLATVGLAGAVAALSAKLIKRYGNKPSGEKRPLLEDRADGQRGFTLDG